MTAPDRTISNGLEQATPEWLREMARLETEEPYVKEERDAVNKLLEAPREQAERVQPEAVAEAPAQADDGAEQAVQRPAPVVERVHVGPQLAALQTVLKRYER